MEKSRDNLIEYHNKNKAISNEGYTKNDAIREFDEIKNIALNSYDKNGNPNISAALRAIENKAKIAGLYSNVQNDIKTVVNMNEITIDGQQLKLDIGEEFF